jgi:hypothetical protein
MSKGSKLKNVLIAGMGALLCVVALALVMSRQVHAQQDGATGGANDAVIVVQLGDHHALVRPITFTTPISGVSALQASGLDVTVADTSFGPAVCAVEGVGCPADDCFCGGDLFWNYNYWDGSAWQSYPVGAGSSVISQTGALEGWRWGSFGSSMIDATQATAALAGLEWLRSQQSPVDGGYGSMGGTVETMMAIGANNIAGATWQVDGGKQPLSTYSRIQQTKFARDGVAFAGKLAVAIAAADGCWGRRTVQPSHFYSETMSAYSSDSGSNAWAILGALSMSETIPAEAIETLQASITISGGWEWQAGWGPDSNTTSLAIQALVAAGEPISASEVISGLAFLKSTQQADGGFAYDAPAQYGSDANSTAYAVQALAAAGEDPQSDRWSIGGVNPISYLLGLQAEDGGFAWQAGTDANLLATQQAIPALLGRPYPIAVKAAEKCRVR